MSLFKRGRRKRDYYRKVFRDKKSNTSKSLLRLSLETIIMLTLAILGFYYINQIPAKYEINLITGKAINSFLIGAENLYNFSLVFITYLLVIAALIVILTLFIGSILRIAKILTYSNYQNNNNNKSRQFK